MNASVIFVIAFLVAVSLHRVWEGFRPRQLVAGQRQMNWSFGVFFALHVLITAGAFTEFYFVRRSLWWPGSALGVAVLVLSLFVRAAAIRTLGKFWSLHLEIRESHVLVREGIYEVVRHPAYAAILLEVISIPIVTNAWWTAVAAAAVYWPLLLYRLRREERALVEKFGEPYRVYQREVGALVPRWSGKK